MLFRKLIPPTKTREQVQISALAIALLAASTLSAFFAWWSRQHDLVTLLERKVGAARGSVATDAMEHLRAINLSSTFAFLATGLLVFALLAQRYSRPLIQRLLSASRRSADAGSRPKGWIIPLAGGGAVFGWYFSTLKHGFFRYDDFDFLSYARDYSLWEAIWMPHGDHFYPLTRVLVFVLYKFFGVTTWPYNLGALLCFWLVVILGCQLLRRFDVSAGGQSVFIALFLFWSPWAEMLGGYYILSVYLLIAACGLGTVLCYLQWKATKSACAAIGASLCAGVATLLDTSGWYVPPALAVFLAADYFSADRAERLFNWAHRHRLILMASSVTVATCLAVTMLCYTVMSPGLFLSMGDAGQRNPGRLILDLLYLLDVGLLGSMALPFLYARLPVAAIMILAAGAFVAFSLLIIFVWRSADRRQRITLVSTSIVILGSALMVNLGRPSGDTFLVRWSAKHVCPAYIWLCILLALSWQILWGHRHERSRVNMAEITVVALIGFVTAQTMFGAIGLAVSFPPFGYPAEIRDAITRRRNVHELATNIISPTSPSSDSPVAIPTLDGAYINLKHPSLFEYNLSSYLPFIGKPENDIALVRNAAMQPGVGPRVRTVASLRTAVSPRFIELLQRNVTLRDYYMLPVMLRAETTTSPVSIEPPTPASVFQGTAEADVDGALRLRSDGQAVLRVVDSPFDPETLPYLRLRIEHLRDGQRSDFNVGVAFQTDFDLTPVRGTLHIPASEAAIMSVDLRQLYAFALSRHVSNLKLVFSEPGTYRIAAVELSK